MNPENDDLWKAIADIEAHLLMMDDRLDKLEKYVDHLGDMAYGVKD